MPVRNMAMNHNLAMSTSSKADPFSNHTTQLPQNKYGWLTAFIFGLFHWVLLPVHQVLIAVIIMARGGRQPTIDGRGQQESVVIANDVPQAPATPLRDSSTPSGRQAEERNPLPSISEPATILVATQFQATQGFAIDGHQQQASGDVPQAPVTSPHDSSNPPSIQPECHNPLPSITGPTTFPVATQLQGSQGFTISGNPVLTIIGMNTGVTNVTTVNNYGGIQSLEKLEKFVSFAALHDSAEQDPKRRCHPGTRKYVLSQLRDWFDNLNAADPICWLHGPAGAGKSAIAQTIAHEYKERGVAATFFFYRSDGERNNGNRLFATIAWQLAFSIPVVKNFIVDALDKAPHLPRKDVETQFEQLVVRPTNNIASQLSQPAPVVIIDGVDECSDEELQRRFLTVIGNAVKDSRVPLHFLICSRPEALIEEVLTQFKDFTLRIDLATLDDSNRDIEKYLVDQFSVIASKGGLAPTWPGPETIEEFVFKSSGNFIFAVTVVRWISDEDCDPEEQLDIIRDLKPHGNMSPFALLDELYLEILKQQRDQDFLKTFLALLIGRSSIESEDLNEDDAMLMNVSKKNLHRKLRKMHSLLQFEPFIDVHHKSFLDFLQHPSRSGQYHVSEQGGQKVYMELIVECVFRHVSTVIEQPNDPSHEKCRSKPNFRFVIAVYPPMMVLPVEDWQETLKPLLDLQDRFLHTLKPQPCYFSQAMRELLLHLVILQGNHRIAAAQVLEPNINETVSPTPVIEARQNPSESDLDRCLSVLLETNSALTVDTVIIERMSFLLAFDYAETVTHVRSVTDAQKLIDLIDLLINNETFLNQYGRDAARKAALLASDIYARVPLLPRSVFLKGPTQQWNLLPDKDQTVIEFMCQTMFISRILDHTHILPPMLIYQGDKINLVYDKLTEQNDTLSEWLKRSSPDFLTRIRVMFEVAKTIRYIHSMSVVGALISDAINLVGVYRIFDEYTDYIALDSNLHAKVLYRGFFAWQVREDFILEVEDFWAKFTPENNIVAFADLFQEVCFGGDYENHSHHLVKDARQLIERCGAEGSKSRSTMENVVKEMETWNLN